MHVCNAYIYICTVYIRMYIHYIYIYIYTHIYIYMYIHYIYISELDQGLVSIRFMQHSESTGSVEKDIQVVSALKSEFLLHKTRQCEKKTTPIKAVKRKSPHEPDMYNTWRHTYIPDIYIYTYIYIEIYIYYTDTQDMKHIHILLWHVRWWNPHFGLIKSHPWVPRMT